MLTDMLFPVSKTNTPKAFDRSNQTIYWSLLQFKPESYERRYTFFPIKCFDFDLLFLWIWEMRNPSALPHGDWTHCFMNLHWLMDFTSWNILKQFSSSYNNTHPYFPYICFTFSKLECFTRSSFQGLKKGPAVCSGLYCYCQHFSTTHMDFPFSSFSIYASVGHTYVETQTHTCSQRKSNVWLILILKV